MIVEDDKIVASELYNLLTNSSYEATILTNFENALETILKSNSDLILLDINIPYLNGELLLKNIRKKSNIPIIMVTSKTNEADEALSIMYGADDYIIKPYNPTILLLRISNIFKRCEQKLDIIKLVILTILLIALIVVSIVLIVKRQTNDDEQDDKVLAYTELVKEIQNKNVKIKEERD